MLARNTLGSKGVDAGREQHYGAGADRVRRAQQAAEVAGVAQAVEQQQQRLRGQAQIRQCGLRQREGDDQALGGIAAGESLQQWLADFIEAGATGVEALQQFRRCRARETRRAIEDLLRLPAGLERHVQRLQAFGGEAALQPALAALAELAQRDDVGIAE